MCKFIYNYTIKKKKKTNSIKWVVKITTSKLDDRRSYNVSHICLNSAGTYNSYSLILGGIALI